MSETVRFLSEHRALRMLRVPFGERILANNSVATTSPEVVYEFENGALELRTDQDVLPDGWNEETGTFDRPQSAVEWIRTTPEYGDKVIEVVPMAPDPAPLYMEIGRLEAAGDIDGLVALGDAEDASWGREAVLDQIRDAMERISQPVSK